MPIWRKQKHRTEKQELNEEKTSIGTQSSTSNSCLTHLNKELIDQSEGKSKANEEELSLKAPTIPDLNVPYKEGNNGDVILMPSKRNNSSMIKTPEATMKIHKYQISIPPKLIVKGCHACYIFVMVQETDQRCPNCHLGTYLFDVCHDFHASKKRLI